MYRCESCSHLFEEGEEKVLVEPHEHFGTPCEETFYVCPMCEGDYTEVEICKICGEYTDKRNDEICEECRIKTVKKFKNMWEDFEVEEQNLLSELIQEGELL